MSDVEFHHSPEEAAKAFAYAPVILRKLRALGVEFPAFRLYEDASGSLILGKSGTITTEQYDAACDFVFSHRPLMLSKDVGIQFCCGLVAAAKEAELEANHVEQYAQLVDMLVYYDEPQVVLLKTQDDNPAIGVAITMEGPLTYPFLVAEINEYQWDAYKVGKIDLRELFVRPAYRRWYLTDLGRSADNGLLLVRADDTIYRNEEYLPSPGFMASDHTEKTS